MNGRRGFMKIITGALVASAIEIRLAAAPVIEKLAEAVPNYIAVNYMGQLKWVNYSPTVKSEWAERNHEAKREWGKPAHEYEP